MAMSKNLNLFFKMHFSILVLPLAFFHLCSQRLGIMCVVLYSVLCCLDFEIQIWIIKLICFLSLYFFLFSSPFTFSHFHFFFPFYFFPLLLILLLPRHLVLLVLPQAATSSPRLTTSSCCFITLLHCTSSSLPLCATLCTTHYLVVLPHCFNLSTFSPCHVTLLPHHATSLLRVLPLYLVAMLHLATIV